MVLLADHRIPGGWVFVVTGVGHGGNFAACGGMLEVLKESGQVISWQVQGDRGAYHIQIAPPMPQSGNPLVLEIAVLPFLALWRFAKCSRVCAFPLEGYACSHGSLLFSYCASGLCDSHGLHVHLDSDTLFTQS